MARAHFLGAMGRLQKTAVPMSVCSATVNAWRLEI